MSNEKQIVNAKNKINLYTSGAKCYNCEKLTKMCLSILKHANGFTAWRLDAMLIFGNVIRALKF